MTSFTEDMRRRGMVPGSRTLGLRDRPGRRAPRPLPPRLALRALVVAKRLRLADRETMAIETLHVREALVPGPDGRETSRSSPSTSCSRAATGS